MFASENYGRYCPVRVQCPVFLTNLGGKVGKVGKVGRVGRVGRVGKVGKVGKEGKEGRLRE
jgi:hypothetical protein